MSEQTVEQVWYGPDGLRDLLVPIDDLTFDPHNANTHDERNLRAIAQSLHDFGQQKPVVIDPDGMVVVAGNGMLEAAQRITSLAVASEANPAEPQPWTHIAALPSNLPSSSLRAYGITDNRANELSRWDEDVLAEHLGGMREDGFDLDAHGWSEDDLARLLGGPPDFAPDDDEQARLDEREPIACPSCGARFDPTTGEVRD